MLSELIGIIETPSMAELAGSDSEEEDDILEVTKVVTECKSLLQVKFKVTHHFKLIYHLKEGYQGTAERIETIVDMITQLPERYVVDK